MCLLWRSWACSWTSLRASTSPTTSRALSTASACSCAVHSCLCYGHAYGWLVMGIVAQSLARFELDISMPSLVMDHHACAVHGHHCHGRAHDLGCHGHRCRLGILCAVHSSRCYGHMSMSFWSLAWPVCACRGRKSAAAILDDSARLGVALRSRSGGSGSLGLR